VKFENQIFAKLVQPLCNINNQPVLKLMKPYTYQNDRQCGSKVGVRWQ